MLVRQDSEIEDADITAVYSPGRWLFKKAVAKMKREFLANCPLALKKAFGSMRPLNSDYCPHSMNEMKNAVSSKSIMKKFPFSPEVIMLYFIYDFLNAGTIREIYEATGSRILWCQSDMSAMTGGCHYAWDCEGYKNLCGRCPALYSNDPQDITRQNMLYKQEQLKNVDLTVLEGGSYHYCQIRSSTLFKNRRIESIMPPVNEEQFQPGDKAAACRRFGIHPEKKVIFFGAQSFADRRKGIRFLLEALHILRNRIRDNSVLERIHLLIAGRNIEHFANELAFDHTYVGLLSMEEELPAAFQAADLFACSSIQDLGPMMINQSLMSGTPVVAFEMGIALDLVRTGRTGYRAILEDSEDFAKGMEDILTLPDAKLEKLKRNCRELALAEGTTAAQVDKIEDILMEKNSRVFGDCEEASHPERCESRGL